MEIKWMKNLRFFRAFWTSELETGNCGLIAKMVAILKVVSYVLFFKLTDAWCRTHLRFKKNLRSQAKSQHNHSGMDDTLSIFISTVVLISFWESFSYICKVHPCTTACENLLVTWSPQNFSPKWFCQHFKPASSMSGFAIAMSTWPLSFTGRVTLKSSSKTCFLLCISSVQTLLTAFMRSWRPRKWKKKQMIKKWHKVSIFPHVLYLRIWTIALNY